MCTYSITVDEQKIAAMNPNFNREDFGRLIQLYVDKFVESLITVDSLSPSPFIPSKYTYSDTMDLEDARMALHEMVDNIYSQN